MNSQEQAILVKQLAEFLTQHHQYMCVAESCTGGWVAKVLTDLAGSSAWFERGFVTYSNRAKHEMLGVAESTLQMFGAVSEETVSAMAVGALTNSHADFSLSVSGIAGPEGGSNDKPVGLVWFSWAIKENEVIKNLDSHKIMFDGDRDSVRFQSVEYALTQLIKYL